MKRFILNKNYKNIEDIVLDINDVDKPSIDKNSCLMKASTVVINPSDALADLGYFPHSKLPRTPGRDYSGLVVEGPRDLIGKRAWVPVEGLALVLMVLYLNILKFQPVQYQKSPAH